MKQKQSKHKIGLYIRVSTEEQASNPEGSIKSQEQRLRSAVDFRNLESNFGEVVRVFVDRAKSGKDTNRPELQKLLNAVRNKEITLVMVTELSRLSRSIKDFCEIWELMRAHGCEFQSLREQFDTTSAAGEMVLYTIANIAQFERKQCSERISANFKARAERGLFNGGSVPFGLELDPEKKGHLRPHPEHAETVREIFRTFVREGTLSATAKALNERGIRLPKKKQGGGDRQRLGHFTFDNLHYMLRNKVYIGVRTFLVDGEKQTSKACWDPIVDEDTFNDVGAILKSHYHRFKTTTADPRRYPFLLSGLVFCAKCGDTMNGKSGHGNGGKFSYYEHGWSIRRQSGLNKKFFDCTPNRVSVKIMEPLIWAEIEKLLANEDVAKRLIEDATAIHAVEANTKETDRLKAKLKSIDEQIEAIAEHLTKIPKGVSPQPIFEQMANLEKLRGNVKAEYEAVLQSDKARDLPVPFQDYQAFLKLIGEFVTLANTPELKRKIVQKLVHRIEITNDTVVVHFFVGKDLIAKTIKKGDGYMPSPALNRSNFSSSNRLTNGWLDWG